MTISVTIKNHSGNPQGNKPAPHFGLDVFPYKTGTVSKASGRVSFFQDGSLGIERSHDGLDLGGHGVGDGDGPGEGDLGESQDVEDQLSPLSLEILGEGVVPLQLPGDDLPHHDLEIGDWPKGN